jgi:geranylgeranyl diphosphate synthase type II
MYNKTYKLITAPLLIASIMANNKYFDELKEFGYHLGCMFQIVDDIMDVEGELSLIGKTPHKDSKVDKLTSIKVFGLDGAKKKAEYHYNTSKKILSKLDNCEFLSAFNDAMYNRKS